MCRETEGDSDGLRYERHDTLGLFDAQINREATIQHERDAILPLKLGLHERDFPPVHDYFVMREWTWERHAERFGRELLVRFHRASFRVGA